eukprot:1141969-Rhodomonas_salina.3
MAEGMGPKAEVPSPNPLVHLLGSDSGSAAARRMKECGEHHWAPGTCRYDRPPRDAPVCYVMPCACIGGWYYVCARYAVLGADAARGGPRRM